MCRAVDYISAMSRTLSMCILNPLLKLLWLLSFVFCTSSLIDFKPSARIAMNITGFRFSEQIKSAPAQWRLAWQLSEWAMWKCVFMVIVNNLVTLFSCFDAFIICNSNGFFFVPFSVYVFLAGRSESWWFGLYPSFDPFWTVRFCNTHNFRWATSQWILSTSNIDYFLETGQEYFPLRGTVILVACWCWGKALILWLFEKLEITTIQLHCRKK